MGQGYIFLSTTFSGHGQKMVRVKKWVFLDPKTWFSAQKAVFLPQDQGFLFVIIRSFSGQLKIRFIHYHQLKIRVFSCITNQKISNPQAFNSLLVRNVYFWGITNLIYYLPSQTCNHLENAMYASKHMFYMHQQFWAFQPKTFVFNRGDK